MIKEIDRLSKEQVKKIYKNIIESLSFSELKEMRTEDYWEEKDGSFNNIGKMEVTIEFYMKYKGKTIEQIKKENGIRTSRLRGGFFL